jgi:glycosyl transferase family 25
MWSFFGDIRCINLTEREDRYESAKKVFSEFEIPVNFHRVERSPNGGVQGCFESHVQVITDAHQRGLDTVLVFEDDIEPGYGLNEKKIEEAIDFMQTNEDWDIVFLGWHPRIRTHRTRHVSGSMYKVSALGGHAYIVSSRMMKKMANKEFKGTPIDEIYAENKNAYALYPSAFVQSGSDSDLVGNISSSKWSKPYRRAVEWWAINVNYRLDALIKILGILLVIIIISLLRRKMKPNLVAFWIVTFIALLVVFR